MFKTQCRICLHNNNDNKLVQLGETLQSTTNSKSVTYLEAFQICTHLYTADSKEHLCVDCAKTLKLFYDFTLRAKHADEIACGRNDLPSESCVSDPFEESDDDDWNMQFQMEPGQNKEFTKDVVHNIKIVDVSAANVDEFIDDEQIFPRGSWKCNECDQSYFTQVGLEAHMMVHSKQNVSLRKSRCMPRKPRDKTPPVAENIANEMIAERLAPPTSPILATPMTNVKKSFGCQVCCKTFISGSKLHYHMLTHTGERNYLCTICPKTYPTIYALKHHIRAHSGERPYECTICGDRFLRPTTLKSHMRRHTGERPYACELCDKRFIQHSSMTTHMKLNHMDRTIACPQCDKKYARKSDLATHLLSHTGAKPFACELCPSRFIRQSNLNKHMTLLHQSSAPLAAKEKSHNQQF